MPYRNMTLDELARHIGMDAREVRRLANRGILPGRQVRGEWRFNSVQMLDWLQREMHTLGEKHIRNLEQAMSDRQETVTVDSLLAAEAVDMDLRAKSKPSVLRELVSLAERTGLVYDRVSLVRALEEREATRSTALPNGIALPHAQRPLPYATAEPLLCLARTRKGIPFSAPDRKLTDLFVLVVSHDERQHLHVLARLSQMFVTDLPANLRETDDAEAALTLVLQTERQLLARR